MPTDFQEFLREKSGPTRALEQRRNREEWLGAINRLFEEVRKWLREADPDGLIEIVPYRVEQVEERLGVFDAPALRIRLGTEQVNIVPVGRYSIGLLASQFGALAALLGEGGSPGPEGPPGARPSRFSAPFAALKALEDRLGGRVDITIEERKHILLRVVDKDGQERWHAMDDRGRILPFDRDRLEAVLQDLMSSSSRLTTPGDGTRQSEPSPAICKNSLKSGTT